MRISVLICLIAWGLLNSNLVAQTALTNAGASIKVVGPAVNSTQLTLVVLGDFENQSDINLNDGSINLEDNGHMYVTGDWLNNSMSTVFQASSVSLLDGLVTLENTVSNQIIGGLSPTAFENLSIIGQRKVLTVDDNSVNNVLLLDAPLILNTRVFELKKPNPNAISYKSGFIKSETLPGNHGYLRWNTGNYVGAIEIPFGSDGASLDDDLRMVVDIKSPMALADYFTFATYPSDMYNLPMPFGASNLDVEVRKVVDRYWIVQPSSISNMAPLDILFSYTSQDISSGSNAINPDKLLAARNNTVAAEWLDMYPRGQNYLNTVTISNVLPSEFYPTWTLVNMPPPLTDLFAPDAFSPNGDGVNDLFYPVFQVDFQITSYELFIYNRWGKLVFNTKDINQGWNGVQSGSNAEPLIDVYSWLIIVSGHHNENQNISGKKRKFTGRVTLIL